MYEKYLKLLEKEENEVVLKPFGEKFEFPFHLNIKSDKKYRLFTTGETAMFYQWKDEPDYQYHYRTLTDALNSAEADKTQYCIDLSSEKPEKYVRRLYRKIMWPPYMSYLQIEPLNSDWEFGIFAKGKNICVQEDGYLRMVIDVYYAHEGANPYLIENDPDEQYVIDFPQGDYGWMQLIEKIKLPADKVVSVGVWIEGINYIGELYIERPFLSSDKRNILPDFSVPVPDRERFDWSAQNLSKKEWVKIRVTLNGQRIFENEIFERCHRCSEWEVDLPSEILKEENVLTYEVLSDYHDALPYAIREIGVIEQTGGDLALVACSQVGCANGKAYALIRTEKDNMRVKVNCPDGKISSQEEYVFEEAGLHGISFDCGDACENAEFVLSCNQEEIHGNIPLIALHYSDEVIIGTGDMVYIRQDIKEIEDYLSWYVSENIGNFLTIRPVYRWSGTRVQDMKVWSFVKRILNELGIKYVVMVDGRELPGLDCNPTDEMISGENYLGRQNHEHDGRVYYWVGGDGNISQTTRQINDMYVKMRKERAPYIEHGIDFHIYKGKEVYSADDPYIPHDVSIAHQKTVERLSKLRVSPRHTGPSMMIKYLYEAGYEWIGMETMYSNMELQMAFVRGFCKSINNTSMGVHHALQWSTHPHDAPEKVRRFRLALYCSYMLGATDINTEEGLWHIEEYYENYHRFSECCVNLKKQQQDFYRYISSHSRTGTFYTPFAVIHGRLDGWNGFKQRTWGWNTTDYVTDAEKTWEEMTVFYPTGRFDTPIYSMNCPTDEELGFYSGTPLGHPDVLPIEYAANSYSNYKFLSFMGYNYATKKDFDELASWVQKGGSLLLSRAHFCTTTDYDKVKKQEIEFLEHPLAFCYGKPTFISDTVKGVEVSVCENLCKPDEVLEYTDGNQPLLVKYCLGEGEVILLNANAYPANIAVRDIYFGEMHRNALSNTKKEKVWVKGSEQVEFAVYKQNDTLSHVYFLAVDWYRSPNENRTAILKLEDNEYSVSVPFGTLIKCVTDGKLAVWCTTEYGEVLDIGENICVQGTGKQVFCIAEDGNIKEITVDFSHGNVQII